MKGLILSVTFASVLLSLAFAEDIETLKHVVYKDATITRSEPDGIVVTHSAGIVKIPFTELPEEYAKRFQYDAKKAKEFAEQDARRQEALYSQAQQERQIANARDAQFSAKSAAEADEFIKRKAIAGFVLSAKEAGTSDVSYDTWKTDYGSYDRQIAQDKRIVIAVHDVGGSSATCNIDVYFVGKSMTQNLRFIYAHQLIPLTVRAGIEAKATAKAPVVDSRVLNLAALGAQYAEGAQMEGWIVTGKIGEQGFGMAASNQVMANDAGRLIAEFEAREKEAAKKMVTPSNPP